ncbi:MAG: cytochrome P460 family protein [Opitutaceae bacterium]|nr:cytochrome P460 family protein [Verrucomicrobiales bacterium]
MKNTKRTESTAKLVTERKTRLKQITLALGVIVIFAVTAAFVALASEPAGEDSAPVFVKEIPPGYRDWKLISVAREEGDLDDIRAILGNDIAIKAYREGTLPFPEGAIIARLAWGFVASEENNQAFGRAQSFVAGHPKNGVQFMVKDSKKYAATGGWGYAHFNDGKPANEKFMQSCFPCHQEIKSRDFVFTRYAP